MHVLQSIYYYCLAIMYVRLFVVCNNRDEDGVFVNALVWTVAYFYTVYWTLVV